MEPRNAARSQGDEHPPTSRRKRRGPARALASAWTSHYRSPKGSAQMWHESSTHEHTPAGGAGYVSDGDAPDLHRALLDVTRATASHRDIPNLLRDLVGVLRRVAAFDRVALVLHDPERDVMHVHSLAGGDPTPALIVD